MNRRFRISSSVRRPLRTPLLLLGLALLCAAPSVAASYTVRPGDTLRSMAERFKTTPEILAARNGLRAGAPLRAGAVLTTPDAGANTASPAKRSANPQPAAMPSGKPRAAAKPAPVLDTRVLLDSPMDAHPMGLRAPTARATPERKDGFAIAPVMRPAMDLLTPKDAIERAPKDFNPSAPGLKATLRTGPAEGDLRITGVVNAPGQGSSKSLPILERDAPTGTSAGVLLQKSF